MEQAVVHEVLRVLHTQILVILVVELDLAHGCLNIGDQVHQMPLFKTSLIFHVRSDALNWRKIAQVTVSCKSGGKSSLRAVKKLRIW